VVGPLRNYKRRYYKWKSNDSMPRDWGVEVWLVAVNGSYAVAIAESYPLRSVSLHNLHQINVMDYGSTGQNGESSSVLCIYTAPRHEKYEIISWL
jgi:hypothetical protein